MYAVIRTGGKQARVETGAAVRVEKLPGAVGDRVELSDVLMIGGEGKERIGAPLVSGAKVVGTITAQGRGDKITVFRMKRRSGNRHKTGHRQSYTEVRVERIEG